MKSILLSIFLSVSTFAQDAHVREYPSPLVREEFQTTVNGIRETWRLQWKTPPRPGCGPSEDSLTCPCSGFAFGEVGEMELLRLRRGRVVERLALGPYFEAEASTDGGAMIQRWAPDEKADFEIRERDDFPILVSKRPATRVVFLGDYDHDGWKNEFFLQTAVFPCSKPYGIIVGVSKRNPHLHVFGTGSNPNMPVLLLKRNWEELRGAIDSFETVSWRCDDHGAEEESSLLLRWTPKGIEGVRRTYTCPGGMKSGKLIGETPLQED